jgi:hypothetical protein
MPTVASRMRIGYSARKTPPRENQVFAAIIDAPAAT